MSIVKIVLKGIKPQSPEYEMHIAYLSNLTDDIDAKITAYIYEWRNKNGYYKTKYISKEVISCDN